MYTLINERVNYELCRKIFLNFIAPRIEGPEKGQVYGTTSLKQIDSITLRQSYHGIVATIAIMITLILYGTLQMP